MAGLRIRVHLDPHFGKLVNVKIQEFSSRGSKWSHGGPWIVTIESWRLQMKPWRACRPVAANSHKFDEKQDPDPDPHWSKIRIRIRIKVMRTLLVAKQEKHKNSDQKHRADEIRQTQRSKYPETGNNALLSRGGLRGSADCSESPLILLYLTQCEGSSISFLHSFLKKMCVPVISLFSGIFIKRESVTRWIFFFMI